MRPAIVNRLQIYKNRGKNSEAIKNRRIAASVKARKLKKCEELIRRRKIEEEQVPCHIRECVSVLQNASTKTMGDILTATSNLADSLTSRIDFISLEFLIGSDILPLLVEFLEYDDLSDLQSAAVRVFVSLLSGNADQTTTVLESGVLPRLVRLLFSPHPKVLKPALVLVGNLARESCHLARLLQDQNILAVLIELPENQHFAKTAEGSTQSRENLLCGVLSILTDVYCVCCLTPGPSTSEMLFRLLLPLFDSEDRQVVSNACSTLRLLTESSRVSISCLRNVDLVSKLVHLTETEDFSILPDVLRVLARLTAHAEVSIQTIIDHKIIPPLVELLKHPRPDIMQESLVIVGNVAARTWEGIQHVIDANVVQSLVHVLKKGGYESLRLAAWTASTLCSGCTVGQADVLLASDLPTALCSLLRLGDMEIIDRVLESIQNLQHVLRQHGRGEELKTVITSCGGISYLNALKNLTRRDIKERAIRLIEDL